MSDDGRIDEAANRGATAALEAAKPAFEAMATTAAEKAIAGTFLTLGIDVSTPEARLKAQQVVGFGYRMHALHRNIASNATSSITKYGVLVILILILLGLKDHVRAWFS